MAEKWPERVDHPLYERQAVDLHEILRIEIPGIPKGIPFPRH
jgi:hypothetical protein